MLNDFVLKLLIGAAIISIVAKMVIEQDQRDTGNKQMMIAWVERFAILVAAALLSLVSASAEWKKELEVRRMSEHSASKKQVKVIRSGTAVTVSEEDLVVGDVVRIEAGMSLSADGIVLQSRGVTTDEAAMTGECY